MPYKSFVIPAMHAEWAERELNAFVASHRVLSVDRKWVDLGRESYWAVWVDYLDAPIGGDARSGQRSAKRVDYKQVLDEQQFQYYIQLRTLRKDIAAEEAVDLYRVFTNEQLATMVQERVNTQQQLAGIAGVGETRVEKYGPRFLELLTTFWSSSHEASGEPVPEDRELGESPPSLLPGEDGEEQPG